MEIYMSGTTATAQEPEQAERTIPPEIQTRAAEIIKAAENRPDETRLASCDFMFKNVEDWDEVLRLIGSMPIPKNATVYIRIQEGNNESQG